MKAIKNTKVVFTCAIDEKNMVKELAGMVQMACYISLNDQGDMIIRTSQEM